MERIVEDEWLDDDRGTPAEIDAALHAISLANRRFGGMRLHARLLKQALTRLPREQRPHILEVAQRTCRRAAGSAAPAWRRGPGRAGCHAAGSQRRSPARPACLALRVTHAAHAGERCLALPFPDASVDIVSCCLFLHHLEPPQITRYLAEAQRVARAAVVINDLERRALYYRLAQLNRIIDRSRISRHDGPASVRRAYAYNELARMLANTGCSFLLERTYLHRLGAILQCREPSKCAE